MTFTKPNIAVFLAALTMSGTALAQDVRPAEEDIKTPKSTTEHPFEPEYVGGYPTEETAAAMFEEYDYQAAVQFYVWAYAYLNNLGMEKGLAKLGGDERSFYIFDKRVGPQHVLMTANSEVVYSWPRFVDLAKGPVVFEVPPRCRGHFWT